MVSCALKRAVEDDHIRSIPKMPRQFGERKRTYVLNEEQFDKMMDAVRARDDREQTVRGGHPIAGTLKHMCGSFRSSTRPEASRRCAIAAVGTHQPGAGHDPDAPC